MNRHMPSSANMEQLFRLLRNTCIHLWRGEGGYLIRRTGFIAKNYHFLLYPCPLCGTRFNRMLKKSDARMLLSCPHCALAYVAPPPLPSEIERTYSEANYYENTIWGGGMTPQSYKEAMMGREWLLDEIGFKRYEQTIGPKRRMLEIGSFDGSHLLLFKKRGWEVEGLEMIPSIAQIAINRGITTHTQRLEEAHLPDSCYDFITMNHTLEHIPNPSSAMREIKRILKPSGRLIIQVPQEEPSYLEGGQHLLFFTSKSLERLLMLTGFKALSVIEKQHHNVNTNMDWTELNAYAEKGLV